MPLLFDVPNYKKVRVIVDTDAACEADDPFAIAHALMSPKLIVKGITAEHFNQEGSVERSLNEIHTILKAMEKEVPAYLGEAGPMSRATTSESETSEAVDFIIEEALKEEEHPLFLLCQGAITNVATAFLKCPEIINRVNVVWIGTHGSGDKLAPFREFNAGNDIEAANLVLSSGTDLWLIPSYVYITISIGIAEIQRRIYPYGAIGKHLFEQMVDYNQSEGATWTQGESWSLGDSPAIGVTLNPGCGQYQYVEAPFILEDTSSQYVAGRPKIREYTSIDARYLLEDFISKLQIEYGNEGNYMLH